MEAIQYFWRDGWKDCPAAGREAIIKVPESVGDGGHGGGRGAAHGALPLREAGRARAHQLRAQRDAAPAASATTDSFKENPQQRATHRQNMFIQEVLLVGNMLSVG